MSDAAIADAEVPPSHAPRLRLDEALMASPERFINREVSWLAFNRRVLEEACNERHPLLERLRFLSISGSNLDEFYMVRVAGLRSQVRAGINQRSQDGLSPERQLAEINRCVSDLVRDQQRAWKELKAELAAADFTVIEPADLSEDRSEEHTSELQSH